MLRIAYEQIPTYLHDSELYLSLCSDEAGDYFDVPDQYLVENDCVTDVEEFARILRVIDFWGSSRIPQGLLIYCHSHSVTDWFQTAMHFSVPSHIVKDLVSAFTISPTLDATKAMSTDRTEIIEFLFNQQIFDEQAAATAALYGRLDWLKQISAKGLTVDEAACASAAEGGHLNCLTYLHNVGCKWDATVPICAAREGHLDCLKYALQNDCPWNDEVTLMAVKCEQIKCLKYALAHGCTLHEDACSAAGANLQVLEVLLERGAKLDPLAAAYAAQNNKLNCLDFLYTHSGPWDKNTTAVAAGCGHVNCLRYAMENGCDYDATEVLICAAKAGSLACLQCLIEEHNIHMPEEGTLFEAAFVYAHYPCVQYLLDVGCPFRMYAFNEQEVLCDWKDQNILNCLLIAVPLGLQINDELVSYVLARALHLPETVRYLCTEGYVQDPETVELIAQNFDSASCKMQNIVSAREEGPLKGTFMSDKLMSAVEADDLSSVQSLCKDRCQWEPYITEAAIIYGRLNILKYGLKNGLPFTFDLTVLAASVNRLTCLKYLVEEWNCGEDLSIAFGAAFMGAHVECLQYLCHKRCEQKNYIFSTVRRSDNMVHDTWDARFAVCIETALDHGWVANETLI